MYERIIELIAAGEAEQAAPLIEEEKAKGRPDLQLCLLDATVCEARGNLDGEREALALGFKLDWQNYELFYMLGLMHAYTNVNQAYLCMEQAEFFCKDAVDLINIRKAKEGLKTRPGFSVRNLSVMILSYNDRELMIQCVESFRKYVPVGAYEFVVVDNHSEDGIVDWLRNQNDLRLIENGDNVGFPVGCNIGFRACNTENDILLMNNDAVLTPNSLFWLRMGLYEDRNVGAVGAVSNHASEQNVNIPLNTLDECIAYGLEHNIPMAHPYEERCRLTGFAILLKNECWKHVKIGKDLLDPVFSPGYFEDDDLGVRIAKASYRQLLCHNSLIYHKGGSGFASHKDALLTGRDKFINKWGFDIWAYEGVWTELADLIDDDPNAPVRVLEVYCGMGVNLSHIKHCFPHAYVAGIEPNATVAGIGRYMGDIHAGDVYTMPVPFPDKAFDYIYTADSLQHVPDPAALLGKYTKLAADGGTIISVIPSDEAKAGELKSLLAANGYTVQEQFDDLLRARKA